MGREIELSGAQVGRLYTLHVAAERAEEAARRCRAARDAALEALGRELALPPTDRAQLVLERGVLVVESAPLPAAQEPAGDAPPAPPAPPPYPWPCLSECDPPAPRLLGSTDHDTGGEP